MEWWKLFSGTFVLIFLAELGDKTQLAAMAKTADSPDNSMAKWVVFVGASLALVASTFIAVFLGHVLKSLVPDERWIKIAAGSLFLIFGFMILYETYRSYYPAAETVSTATATRASASHPHRSVVGNIALRAAMDFESYASTRYRRLAANASENLAALLLELAREEDSHLARLRNLPEQDAALSEPLPSPNKQSIRSAPSDPDTLAELIRHEQATADFYKSLADTAAIPSVKAVFASLAQEEKSHADRLADMAKTLT